MILHFPTHHSPVNHLLVLFQGVGDLLGSPSGRLMVYDPQTKKSSVLQEKLAFPKGIILSPDEDFLVIGELLQYRLLKYWLKGPKSGKDAIFLFIWEFFLLLFIVRFLIDLGSLDVFLDGIPGVPDNFNLTPKGNIMFPLVTVAQPDRFDPVRFALAHPWLRKFYLRLVHLIKFPVDVAANHLNLSLAKHLTYNVSRNV